MHSFQFIDIAVMYTPQLSTTISTIFIVLVSVFGVKWSQTHNFQWSFFRCITVALILTTKCFHTALVFLEDTYLANGTLSKLNVAWGICLQFHQSKPDINAGWVFVSFDLWGEERVALLLLGHFRHKPPSKFLFQYYSICGWCEAKQ